jgi:hypothetical protein
MGGSQKTGSPLLEDIDGPILVGLGNWLAESLDAAELSTEQVLLLFMLLDRGIDALWRNSPEVLLPLVIRILERFSSDDV